MSRSKFGPGIFAAIIVMLVVSAGMFPMFLPTSVDDKPNTHDGEQRDSVGEDVDDSGEDPLYVFVEGPAGYVNFASFNIATVGDVNGDGLHDLIIGTNETYYQQPIPGSRTPGNYLMLGREDGDFTLERMVHIPNMSAYWSYPNNRWLGDVNDDGFDDVVSHAAYSGFANPNWLWGDRIQVRHGGVGGLPSDPTMNVDRAPENATWDSRARHLYSGAGDVNGDGYNDLCVAVDATPEYYSQPHYPGALLLYYGSDDGLSVEPDLSVEMSYGNIWGGPNLAGVLPADINGDGYGDLLLQNWKGYNTSLVEIHYGSAAGVSSTPDRSIMVYSYPTVSHGHAYHPDLMAPLDINGDEHDDFMLYGHGSLGDPGLEYVRVYLGDNGTHPLQPGQVIEFPYDTSYFAESPDVNGDGLNDLVTFKTTKNSTILIDGDPGIDLSLDLFLNRDGSFNSEPDWEHTAHALPMKYYTRFYHDFGDFDGDGFEDLAIAASGHWGGNGSLMVILGGRIMGALSCVSFPDGPIIYAGLREYDITVNANPAGWTQLPERVLLTLDPGVANVTLECGLLFGGAYFKEVWDPHDLVDLRSGPMDIEMDDTGRTAYLHFRMVFNWTWPHEEMCAAAPELIPEQGDPVGFPALELFRVENDLRLHGHLLAEGEWQGALEPGDWVRGGENVTYSGPRVVYENTTDLHPPAGVCGIMAEDDDGTSSQVPVGAEGGFELVLPTDDTTDLDETVLLRLVDLPGLAEGGPDLSFDFRVDGDAPAFVNNVPDDVDWQSTNDVLVSITATDVPTSGVDASSLEYSYSLEGPTGFGSWTRGRLSTTVVGPEVEGMATISLPDGTNNVIKWRAVDLVGNVGESGQFVIRVDTRNVSFTDPFPPEGVWQTSTELECGVTIHDNEGSGIQVSTVQYRVSPRNLSQYSEWLDWDEGSQGDAQRVTTRTAVSLAEAPYNYVQWRAFDIAGNGFTASPHYRIPADATPVTFTDFLPEGMQRGPDVTCWASVSDQELGSGVNLSSVEYRYRPSGGEYTSWTSVGMAGESMSNRFSIVLSLPDGEDNLVQYRGLDVAGNGPSESPEHTVAVDSTPPVVLITSPDLEARFLVSSLVVNVSISDEGIGMGAAGAWYRYGPAGEPSLGEWVSIDGTLVGTVLVAEFPIDLVPGPGNSLQLRAMDTLGNEGMTEIYTLWLNRGPVAVIESPEEGQLFYTTERIPLSSNGSHDPDDDALTITWLEEVTVGILQPVEGDLFLGEGSYLIHLRVVDEYGAEDVAVVQVDVEKVEPKPPKEEPIPAWLILLLVLVAVLAVGGAAYLYGRQRPAK